jgi:hypothetical protein
MFLHPIFERENLVNSIIYVNIRYWPDVIGFQLSSKAILTFKHNILGLHLGSKENIKIPKFLIKSKKFLLNCIRWLFEF